jgi:hypothetical protein
MGVPLALQALRVPKVTKAMLDQPAPLELAAPLELPVPLVPVVLPAQRVLPPLLAVV